MKTIPPRRRRVPDSIVFAFITAGIAACLLAPTAQATQVIERSMSELVADSDRILVAEVVAKTSVYTADRRSILSTIELAVMECWKGGMPPGARVKVVQPGGTAGDIEMRVHGMPRFKVGDRAVVFLRAQGPGRDAAFSVVGMDQGRRALFRDPKTEKWMAAPAPADALVRRGPDGKMVPAPADHAISLDDLRRRVATLMAR